MTDLEEIIGIIKTVRQKITDDTDVTWSSYDSVAGLQAEIDKDLIELINGNLDKLNTFKNHFGPTDTFQEIALSNGWGEEFIKLAESYDLLYEKIKNKQTAGELVELETQFKQHCSCLDNPLQNKPDIIFQEIYIGCDETNGRFGDLTARICPDCKFIWLLYSVQYEAFTKSGRWYIGRIIEKNYKSIKPEDSVKLLEQSNPCYFGGSYFETSGKLLKKPKGNIFVDL